jgi:cytochrome c-type biogenesis protein CcmF
VALGCRGTGALVLFFVALAATTANLWRLLEVARGDLMTAGSSMAHLGFGLMFIGIVASSAWGLKQEVKLPIGRPVDAIGMTLTYRGHVDGSEPKDEWRVALLRPGSAEIDSKVSMFNTAGPGEDPSILRKPTITREIGRDLYVAPLGLEPASEGGPVLDLTKDQPQNLRVATITFRRFESGAEPGGEHMMSVQAIVDITRAGSTETLSLPFAVSASGMEGKPVESKSLEGVALAVDRMAVEQKMVRVRLDDGSGGNPEMLLVEASTKPLIGALWAGTIVLAAGCVIAAIRRYREITTMAAAGIPVPAPAGAGPSRAPVLPTVR